MYTSTGWNTIHADDLQGLGSLAHSACFVVLLYVCMLKLKHAGHAHAP